MENVGLLYLKTGGGHYSAARALAQQMSRENDYGAKPVLIDPIEGNKVLKTVLEDGYGKFCTDMQYMWPALYNIQKSERAVYHIHHLMEMILTDIITEQILTNKLDRLVILHFLLLGPVKAALKKTGLNIPCVTIILDPFTAPPIWYIGNDFPIYCFSDQVASEVMKNQCEDKTMVYRHPIIIDRKFYSKPSKERLEKVAKINNFDNQKKRVLIMSGGEGGGKKSFQLLRYLLMNRSEYEILFVCGKSEKVYSRALKMVRENESHGVFLFGFVDNIHELISLSDLVITKAGPASIMESLFMETPLILNNYMYGQEKGNVEFVEENGLGAYESSPEKIANLILRYMDQDYIDGFFKRLSKLDLKSGTESITRAIMMETSA